MTDGPPPATTPGTIDIERERGVTITWEDGHVSRFDLEDLRTNCPCAQCRGLRQQGEAAWPRPEARAPGAPQSGEDRAPKKLTVETAEQVGNWGLNIHWNDAHTTGIYTWEVLRSWCPCPECEPASDHP